jgi:uncharacterized membrane protein YhiD involved in acid resistance
MSAALGIACGLAAWTVMGIAIVLALAALVGLYWLDRVMGLKNE